MREWTTGFAQVVVLALLVAGCSKSEPKGEDRRAVEQAHSPVATAEAGGGVGSSKSAEQSGQFAAGAAGLSPEIYSVGGDVQAPVAIYQPKPDLSPLGAHGLKLPAVTVFEAVIDERGNVVDLRIVKPVDSKAAELIAAGIRTWRFKPATLQGKPVKVHYTLTASIHYR